MITKAGLFNLSFSLPAIIPKIPSWNELFTSNITSSLSAYFFKSIRSIQKFSIFFLLMFKICISLTIYFILFKLFEQSNSTQRFASFILPGELIIGPIE